MKLKLYAEETFTTTLTRERVIIDTDNYPELEGMDEDQIHLLFYLLGYQLQHILLIG